MEAVVIIPARLSSKRLPAKVLAKIGRKTMLEHVYLRAQKAKYVKKVYVATADDEIIKEVKSFGGNYIRTSCAHSSGTSRVAEACRNIKANIIINLQADEPLLKPLLLDRLIELLEKERKIVLATAIAKIRQRQELNDPNVVKVVLDNAGYIIYFSRSPIPYQGNCYYKHLGIYAFRKKFLLQFPYLKPSYLERLEKLEQLRILANGYKIKALETKFQMIGVDTPEDLEKVRRILSKDG